MTNDELRQFLDEKTTQYNNPDFIAADPIQIPHRYSRKEDIEIAAFLTAAIAWGNRPMIIKNAGKMTDLMGNTPYDFVMAHDNRNLEKLQSFVHRTFNGTDFVFFIKSLQNIYLNHNGLEAVFSATPATTHLKENISEFRKCFFAVNHPQRTQKHISNPDKGAACKRLNMFLRWMVRRDAVGVDFGIWKRLTPSQLSCPLDVHSGRVARKLGLLSRKSNDWKAVEELDAALRNFDSNDPVKYDFALFGLGVFEKF